MQYSKSALAAIVPFPWFCSEISLDWCHCKRHENYFCLPRSIVFTRVTDRLNPLLLSTVSVKSTERKLSIQSTLLKV